MERVEDRTCRSWGNHWLAFTGDLRASLRRTIQVGDDDLDWPSDETDLIVASRPSQERTTTLSIPDRSTFEAIYAGPPPSDIVRPPTAITDAADKITRS